MCQAPFLRLAAYVAGRTSARGRRGLSSPSMMTTGETPVYDVLLGVNKINRDAKTWTNVYVSSGANGPSEISNGQASSDPERRKSD